MYFSGFSRHLSGSLLGRKVGWRGCFTLISLSLSQECHVTREFLRRANGPINLPEPLSICLRGMSAGKCPDTENLLSRYANLTDEIPCWSCGTRTGMGKLPRALSMSLYVYPSEVPLLRGPLFGRTQQLTLTAERVTMTKCRCQPRRNP